MTRPGRFSVVTVVLAGLAFLSPSAVPAQCVVTNTTVISGGTSNRVYKYLGASGTCRSVGNNSVIACFPPASLPLNTNILRARALASLSGASCSFACTCLGVPASITIDAADGLPVELMDFEIEPGDSDSA